MAAFLVGLAFVILQGVAPSEPAQRPWDRQLTAPETAVQKLGLGPKPPWWGGACTIDPGGWGGWDDGPQEVYMHVLDVPKAEYPNIRFGFVQWLVEPGQVKHREVYVLVAHDPPDFLVDGLWRRWKLRVDTDYEWRYFGYWWPPNDLDAVVVERELPGLVEFCRDDLDGKIWVVLQFDASAWYMVYWSEYPHCPRTYTYGVRCGEWGRVTAITRWPVPYQWPPCYVLWTDTGHRIW